MERPVTHSVAEARDSTPDSSTSRRRRRRRFPQFAPLQVAFILCLVISLLTQLNVINVSEETDDLSSYFSVSSLEKSLSISESAVSSSVEDDEVEPGPSSVQKNDKINKGKRIEDESIESKEMETDVDGIGKEKAITNNATKKLENVEDIVENSKMKEDMKIDEYGKDANKKETGKDVENDASIKNIEKNTDHLTAKTEKEPAKTDQVEITNDGKNLHQSVLEVSSQSQNMTTVSMKNMVAPVNSTLLPCAFQNSQQWLNGTRLSNIDEEDMTDELIQDLILHVSPMDLDSKNGSKAILEQSICVEGSGFLNWDQKPKIRSKNPIPEEDLVVQQYAIRLMYLALHEHQYGPAREEALLRYGKKDGCEGEGEEGSTYSTMLTDAGVGRMDYECPNTKYILTTASDKGFGASIRSTQLEIIQYGLSTGRVALSMNGLKVNKTGYDEADVRTYVRNGWKLSSCPRQDMQCMYMPLSPCTLTEEEVRNAKILSNEDVRTLRKTGKLPEQYKNDKVVFISPRFCTRMSRAPHLREQYVNIISSFYEMQDKKKIKKAWQLDDVMLQKIYDYIRKKGKKDGNINIEYIANHATQLFIIRPNMHARKLLNAAEERIFPKDYDPMTAVGFPIRGELSFFSFNFDQYLHRLTIQA